MIPKDGLDIPYALAALRRRLWYVALPFFLVATGTIVYCIKAPRIYQSSTLLLVQEQEVPADYVRPTVTSDTRSRLNVLQEQVLSRPRLEEIIKRHNLYADIRERFTMFDAVEEMRKNVTVTIKDPGDRYRAAPAAFEISYEGENALKVKEVTAAIATLFIEDNMKLRESQAVGTSQFLDREMERMREELRKKEEQVREFKEKHMGLLPEQMESNYRILGQLQQQLDSINVSLQQTEDRKVMLRTQLGTLETVRASSGGTLGQTAVSGPSLTGGLDQLRQALETLKSRYTDTHPDIVRLKATIEKMEQEQAAPGGALPDAGQKNAASAPTQAERLLQAHRDDLSAQMGLIDRQLRGLGEDKKKVEAQIRQYRERIESGPEIEQMFVDLSRGYEEANENYQSLLQKKLQADLAENLERTQKGEQFVILEYANLPQKAIKPNVWKVLSMGLMLSLGAGLGLAFLREYLDPTFWRSKDVESIAQIPVLVSIPIVSTKGEHRMRILKRIGTAGALASMASVLLYALFMLYRTDPTAFPFLMR